jgi:hypothetical protein
MTVRDWIKATVAAVTVIVLFGLAFWLAMPLLP